MIIGVELGLVYICIELIFGGNVLKFIVVIFLVGCGCVGGFGSSI